MKRRLTCAVLALCLLLSGCAATGTTSPQRYSVTWWDVFDTVTVISGYADSEADWNTQMTALHADLLRYNQLYDIYNHYDGITNLADVNAGAAAAPVAVGDEIMNLLTFAQEMYQATAVWTPCLTPSRARPGWTSTSKPTPNTAWTKAPPPAPPLMSAWPGAMAA